MPMSPPFHMSLPTIQALVAVGDRPAEQRSFVRRFGRGLLDKITEGLAQARPGPVDMVAPMFGANVPPSPPEPSVPDPSIEVDRPVTQLPRRRAP